VSGCAVSTAGYSLVLLFFPPAGGALSTLDAAKLKRLPKDFEAAAVSFPGTQAYALIREHGVGNLMLLGDILLAKAEAEMGRVEAGLDRLDGLLIDIERHVIHPAEQLSSVHVGGDHAEPTKPRAGVRVHSEIVRANRSTMWPRSRIGNIAMTACIMGEFWSLMAPAAARRNFTSKSEGRMHRHMPRPNN
jgi:hypothetical protein